MSETEPARREREEHRMNTATPDEVVEHGHVEEPETDKWWLSGRRARRAYTHGHAWAYPGRQGPEQPERSRRQRKTAEQRRTDRKVTAHETRKAKRRARREAAAEVAA